MIAAFACFLIAALLFALARRNYRARKLAAARPRPLDISRLRHESHALGLPFPEQDGTLSFPPPTAEQRDQATHDAIHARRWAAEDDAARGRLADQVSDFAQPGPFTRAERRRGWPCRTHGYHCALYRPDCCGINTR